MGYQVLLVFGSNHYGLSRRKPFVSKGGNKVESLEQELMAMLRRLPTPILITWRSGLYHWQCAQETGSSHRLISAVEAALNVALHHPKGQMSVTEREKSSQ